MSKYPEDLRERAFRFGVTVFRLYPRLAATSVAHALVGRQLLKAATSIGANLEEAAAAGSRRDMAAKQTISLKESREAVFWGRIGASDPGWRNELSPIVAEAREFVAMLTTSVRKLREP